MFDVRPAPLAPLPAVPSSAAAARRLAPFVAVATLALALINVVALVLNLDERGLQQRLARGEPVDASSVHGMLGHIKATSNISLALALVFLVVAGAWSRKRRAPQPHPRLPGAEVRGPSLRLLEPALWWSVMALIGVSVFITVQANALSHAATNHSDVATYRAYLAAGDGVRAAMWAGWFVMVVRVTWLRGVAATQQRDDPAGRLGNVGAGTEHGGHAGLA